MGSQLQRGQRAALSIKATSIKEKPIKISFVNPNLIIYDFIIVPFKEPEFM